jgi:hypothetical protein
MPTFWVISPLRIAAYPRLKLDLDIDTGRKVELHQSINGLRSRVDNVEKALVRTDFELFT